MSPPGSNVSTVFNSEIYPDFFKFVLLVFRGSLVLKYIQSIILVVLFSLVGCSKAIDYYSAFSKWMMTNSSNASVAWSKFQWVNGKLGGKQYQRIAMNIPCSIEGVANPLTMQLDLGANLTGIYETTFSSFYKISPALSSKIKPGSGNRLFENLTIRIGSYSFTNNSAYVYENYGNKLTLVPGDTIHIGTVGADIFQNKILIIDYPNKRFAICDQLPLDYSVDFVNIELDKFGRVILPMNVNGKLHAIMFDTGSSLFSLITTPEKINLFSTSVNSDTIQVSTFGVIHNVTGKLIDGNVEIAGKSFSNVKVYASTTGVIVNRFIDGLTGNILFWNNTVVIDFKNKRFGFN